MARNKRRSILMAAVTVTGVVQMASAANVTWTGGGLNNNWTTALNWGGSVAPAANDTLVFDGFTRLAPVNDTASATAYSGLLFNSSAGAFNLTGNGITLGGDITDNVALLNETVSLALTLSNHRNVIVSDQAQLTLAGAISDGGSNYGLVKQGNGTLTLTAS